MATAVEVVSERSRLALAALLIALIALPPAAALAASPGEIGAVVAARQVTGIVATDERKLAKGDALFEDETLVSAADGSGEFELKDGTRIALGPGARLTLDETVYDAAGGGAPSVVLNLIQGAFRFLTGKLDHSAYKIKAGSASLAVRGTVFDVFVDAENGVAVLLHEGAVEVCGVENACERHDSAGRVLHVTRLGKLGRIVEWSDALMPGIRLKRAFPFLSRRLAIDPVRRIGRVAIVGKTITKSGGKVLKRAGRTARKVGRKVRRVLKSPF